MTSGRQRSSTYVTLAFLVCVSAGGAYLVRRDQRQIVDTLLDLSAYRLAISSIFALAAMCAILMAWLTVARACGAHLSFTEGRTIFPVAQLTKYVPGAVWPVLAQSELGRRTGTPRTIMAAAGIIHLLLTVGIGLVIGTVAAPFVLGLDERLLRLSWIAALLLMTLLTPPMLNLVLALIARTQLGRGLEPGALRCSSVGLLKAATWCVVANACFGVHVWALLPAASVRDVSGFALAVVAYALSSSIGVLVVFAPAGAGAREATMALLLAPTVSAGPALVVAVASRLILMVVDLALAAAQFRALQLLVGPASRPIDEEGS